VAGSCEHNNQPSSSIKGGEFLVSLSEGFVPWSSLEKRAVKILHFGFLHCDAVFAHRQVRSGESGA